jgi:predicted nucleic acid-binding Zn ribbon protein
MDPTDYFIYDEFLNPGMKYECQNCGTRFGDECVVKDETQCIAVCPACGAQAVINNEDG